jgi:hypothetical protein
MGSKQLIQVFDELFEDQLRKQLPHHKAYDEAEKIFKAEYNHSKYASFESYRFSRSKRIKSRNK